MSASSSDRAHVRAVELSVECDALGHEVARLVAEMNALADRGQQVRALVVKRVTVMRSKQQALSGLLDDDRVPEAFANAYDRAATK